MKSIIYALPILLLAAVIHAHAQGLAFNGNGKFRIVQFADIHYKTGEESSIRTIAMMNRILDAEKPDLVVFTGDNVISNPQQAGWDEILDPAIARGIPHAVTLGNHDDEHDWTRGEIIDYISAKPYSLSRKGPASINGVANYVLEVSRNDAGGTAAVIYILDSGAYNAVDGLDGYDWFGYNQVEWFRATSGALTRGNRGKPFPALAFFHIPFHEYSQLWDTTRNYIKAMPKYGVRTEKECPGILNTGMYAAMVEAGDVIATFVGHDHNNDYIGYLNGICLAYGRCTGVGSAYNNIGYGARIIELTRDAGRTFTTWIRDEQDQVLHPVTYPTSFFE
ncbi:MAG: metallophosphoesterase [Tannerellaceae bacterium]|jgi:hypothetical protein|nr:metallophosphoesterase [Tannerellaceae bacterium]